MQVDRLSDLEDARTYAQPVSRWMTDAASPYLPWLLGSQERAREFVFSRLDIAESEYSRHRTHVLLEDGQCIGGFVALPGTDLPRARRADLFSIVSAAGASDSALLARLRAARQAFAPVPAESFYLSKIGILPSARSRGLGALLLKSFLQMGAQMGHRCYRLDVSHDNAVAMALYERFGFTTVHTGTPQDRGVRYVAMELMSHAQ